MCNTCDKNAQYLREQSQMNYRVQKINQSNPSPQLSTTPTVGINQQLAIAAYQQRVALELQTKPGIKSSVKRYR